MTSTFAGRFLVQTSVLVSVVMSCGQVIALEKKWHESEVGWASRSLAQVFGIPLEDHGFAAAMTKLAEDAALGRQISDDQIIKSIELGLKGVEPGATTAEWIARVDFRRGLIADEPVKGLIGDRTLRSLHSMATQVILKQGQVDGDKLRSAKRALLIVQAESDFNLVAGLIVYLQQDDALDGLLLSDEEERKLKEFLREADARAKAFNMAMSVLFRVLQNCRTEGRIPTEPEEDQIISALDLIRKQGAVSQSTWWDVARTSHAILRLSGVPAEEEINTRFAKYLREWETGLPESNAKRWLRLATTAGREVEPQMIHDGRQLRPVAPP